MVPQAPGPGNPKTSTRTPFQGLAFRFKTNPRPQKPLPFAAVLKHLLERCCPVEFDEDITKQDEQMNKMGSRISCCLIPGSRLRWRVSGFGVKDVGSMAQER